MNRLYSPWRYPYVASHKSGRSCIFCKALSLSSDEEGLMLYRGKQSFIILNAFPYNNGHLMIAPYAHISSFEESDPELTTEIIQLMQKCIKILSLVYKPDGFNIGLNLGKVAGAGITNHYHWHIVPRWNGDTSFMTVVSDTRVIPEDPKSTYKKLKSHFQD